MPAFGIIGLSWKTRQWIAVSRSGRSARAVSRRRLPIRHQGQMVSEKMSIWIMWRSPCFPMGAVGLTFPAFAFHHTAAGPRKPKGAGKIDAGMDMDGAGAGIYEAGLGRNAANTAALTPVTFLRRAAAVYSEKTAVVHGSQRFTYAQFHERACRLASALRRRGLKRGDCVAIMSPNTPPMLEAHYGVPMMGGVLNSLNIRLDARTIAFILEHGEAKVLLTDREFSPVIRQALAMTKARPLVVDIDDPLAESGELIGDLTYEALLAEGDPAEAFDEPADEWQSISLLYTSGTTGNPKGVVYHHRGAYLNAVGNMLTFGLGRDSVYLWTLPMFHCDGWTFTWAVTAAGGTHVMLRAIDPDRTIRLIQQERVTHFNGAPTVLLMLAEAPAARGVRFDPQIRV